MVYNLQWKPYLEFITCNFETVKNIINNQISSSTQLNSTLIPISVASCIHFESGKQVTMTFHAKMDHCIIEVCRSIVK